MNNELLREMALAKNIVEANMSKDLPLEVLAAALRIAAEACNQEIARQALVSTMSGIMRKI